MNKLILVGAGGHSEVVQDIVAANGNLDLYAIVDDAFNETVETDGIIHANTNLIEKLDINDYEFCIAIGNNHVRKKLYEKFNIPVDKYVTLIHPSAVISKSAKIGYGTVVMPNAVINADTVTGNHCIVNTNAVVEHDNVLADYVHVSPSATLAGTVSVGEGTHIGAGAVVIPGKNVGKWSVVGAGAVVIRNISENVTAVGNPAREIN